MKYIVLVINLTSLALLSVGCFILIYGLISALSAASVALLSAVASSGIVIGIINITYGISTMFNNWSEGLFETGLSIIIWGLTLILSILIFNFIAFFVPYLFKKSNKLLKYFLAKIKELFNYIKKGCYGI